jgi:hypothetical protein
MSDRCARSQDLLSVTLDFSGVCHLARRNFGTVVRGQSCQVNQ